MRKITSILLALILVLLNACSNSHSENKTTNNPDCSSTPFASEPILQTEPYHDVKNQLIGTWKNDYWDIILYFPDHQHLVDISIEAHTSDYILDIDECTYEIIDENTLSVTGTYEGETFTETYNFSVSGNELILETSYHLEFTRIPERENNSIAVGNWQLFGTDQAPLYSFNSRNVIIGNLILYNDGTYTLQSDYPHHGDYTVVHDGASLCLDGEYYWSISFPCPQVMVITFPRNYTTVFHPTLTYVYVAQ